MDLEDWVCVLLTIRENSLDCINVLNAVDVSLTIRERIILYIFSSIREHTSPYMNIQNVVGVLLIVREYSSQCIDLNN